ncbi:hypothetical protein P5V15_007991 [Pogonomyrmex californicus]
MGKGRQNKPKKNFAEKRREKLKKKDTWDSTPCRSYADIIRENKDFENYYKTQGIVLEDKWDAFISTIRTNLPVAFRITGSKSEAKALLEIIKGDFFKEILNANLDSNKEVADDPAKTILRSLPFYPEELAWQLQLTRKDIRRSEAYFRLHNFLIAETNNGSISRQEVVSMVPPLVLDVKPSHKVLDMCAAPGSKTAQLIEMIHADEGNNLPEGFVIANDVDNNRCYMLVHQAKRLNSPNILITNHDSSIMPNFMITKSDGTKDVLKFDRILADVPCSGDGTMRKNPDIWCKWSPANGSNLHGIQYRIAKRGLELLAVGGRMVYSTCSLNPIENEAVLHRILSETGDSVQLVDCRNLVPGLICDPGVTYWKPASKNLQYYESWDDVPEQWQTQVRPKMFPPKANEASKFHLERWQVDFYGISDDLDPRCLLVRCHEGKKKNIYFTSPAIRDVVISNENKVKMINTGVKTFVRCDNKNMNCAFRLAQEGMHSIIRYISNDRKVQISKEDLIMLLQNDDPHTPPEIVKLSSDTQERLKEFATGSCILLYEEKKTDNINLNLQLVGWRGTMSLRAYVPTCDAIHFLRLLGADCSKFEKNKFEENRAAALTEETNNDEVKTED